MCKEEQVAKMQSVEMMGSGMIRIVQRWKMVCFKSEGEQWGEGRWWWWSFVLFVLHELKAVQLEVKQRRNERKKKKERRAKRRTCAQDGYECGGRDGCARLNSQSFVILSFLLLIIDTHDDLHITSALKHHPFMVLPRSFIKKEIQIGFSLTSVPRLLDLQFGWEKAKRRKKVFRHWKSTKGCTTRQKTTGYVQVYLATK